MRAAALSRRSSCRPLLRYGPAISLREEAGLELDVAGREPQCSDRIINWMVMLACPPAGCLALHEILRLVGPTARWLDGDVVSKGGVGACCTSPAWAGRRWSKYTAGERVPPRSLDGTFFPP